MEHRFFIKQAMQSSYELKKKVFEDENISNTIAEVINEIKNALKNNRKVLFCGNGGSAADAQHLSAELAGKFYLDRDPINAEALNVNTSFLTAVANDISFNDVFTRAVKSKGKKGDILVAISTSGNSINIINAIAAANNLQMISVGMTGQKNSKMDDICKYLIKVPSIDTPRIQEAHILIGHIICELVEKSFFGG